VRVVVTGSSGFLASHVIGRLLAFGHDVVGVDRRPSSTAPMWTEVGDLDDPAVAERIIDGADAVVHLAAFARGDDPSGSNYPAYASTVSSTASIVAAAIPRQVRIVLASTWEVYGGQPDDVAVLTEATPPRPDHPYGVTKLAAEGLVLSAGRLHGVPSVVLRLSTAYGAGLRGSAVMRAFRDRAVLGETLVVYGRSSSRQFTHGDDIAAAVVAAVESPSSGIVVNIASPTSTTIASLAETIARRYAAPIEIGPDRPGEPRSLPIDTSLAASLGWEARIPFDVDAILDTWDRERQ
jgi:UDP-glucose 4-epimerase